MMKLPLLILPFGAALMINCGGPPQNPPPAQAPLPPPSPTAGLDPAPAGGDGAPPGAPAPPRAIQLDEFTITITADNLIASLVSVPVHVISTNTQTAADLVAGGAPNYWQSPWGEDNVRRLQFGQKGSAGTSTIVRAPSVPRMNAVVLVADLAAPAGGNDFRILNLPLELDYSDPLAPVAHPISVRLTRNGWQRVR